MPRRLVQIWERFLEFWNRYDRKQKAIVLSSISVVIVTIAILAIVLTRPVYSVLVTCDDYDEMRQVTTLLKDNGYDYSAEDGNMVVKVRKKDLLNAKMLLTSNEIKPDGYSVQDALNRSFTTTESDSRKMWQTYLKNEFEKNLEEMDKVRSATVQLNLQDSSNSLFQQTTGSSVSVTLDLKDSMDESEAEAIAMLLSTATPNLNRKDITIISQTGEVLYSGESTELGSYTSLNKQLKYQQQINNVVASQIKQQFLNSGLYQDAKVAVQYDIDWSNLEIITHEFSVAEGSEQGYLTEAYIEKSEGTSGVGGVPGTASNDEDTDYYIDNGDGTKTKYSLEKYAYQPNEIVTTKTTTPGQTLLETSTASIVLAKNVVYKQSDAKKLGYLDGISWDEFKAQNVDPVRIEIDEEWYRLTSHGSGIPADNITILAYENHYFIDDTSRISVSFIGEILLALLILALLAFVVLRSTKVVTVEETDAELTVEDMLQSTRDSMGGPSVEDIDLQEKSEVRKAIEKFVAENPEAVALLLRNWLDDGWD